MRTFVEYVFPVSIVEVVISQTSCNEREWSPREIEVLVTARPMTRTCNTFSNEKVQVIHEPKSLVQKGIFPSLFTSHALGPKNSPKTGWSMIQVGITYKERCRGYTDALCRTTRYQAFKKTQSVCHCQNRMKSDRTYESTGSISFQ